MAAAQTTEEEALRERRANAIFDEFVRGSEFNWNGKLMLTKRASIGIRRDRPSCSISTKISIVPVVYGDMLANILPRPLGQKLCGRYCPAQSVLDTGSSIRSVSGCNKQVHIQARNQRSSKNFLSSYIKRDHKNLSLTCMSPCTKHTVFDSG